MIDLQIGFCHLMDFEPNACRNKRRESTSSENKSLEKNRSMPAKKKRHQCPNCEKCFVQERIYWKHMRSHLNYHPYECKTCLECFDRKELLRAHKETHTTTKSYSCNDCSQTFPHISALNRHILTHLERAPYPCPICKATFSTIRIRSRHVKNHVVTCVLCEMDFQDFKQFVRHTVDVHQSKDNKADSKPNYIVPIEPTNDNNLEMMYSSSQSTKYPLSRTKDKSLEEENSNFTCFVCEHCFSTEESMTSHLKAHRIFMCPYCPKFFPYASSLRDHEFTHTGIHPFKCDTCQSIFHSSKLLSCHEGKCKINSLQSVNTNDIHVIMDTINNAVDISSDVKTKVENAIKTILNETSTCETSHQNLSVGSKGTENSQKEMDCSVVTSQLSENLTEPQSMLDESILSTQDLDESNKPPLDLSNVLHLYWLVHFLNEIKLLTCPLEMAMFQKIQHIHSVLCLQLGNLTGIVSIKKNYIYLLHVLKQLQLIISRHLETQLNNLTD